MARHGATDKIETLRSVPLFASLDDAHLLSIAAKATELTMHAGQVLAEEGAMGREAIVILDGSAEVKRGDQKLADLGGGDVVGEMSLINETPRVATVTATSDCHMLVMDSREFSSILDENPDVAIRILRTVAARLVENESAG